MNMTTQLWWEQSISVPNSKGFIINFTDVSNETFYIDKISKNFEKLGNKLREMAKSGSEISDTANKSLYLLSSADHNARWALRQVSYYFIYPNSLKTMHFTVT